MDTPLPLFQAYRRLTPHLRTAYEAEHILKVRDLKRMRRWFGQAQARFFHLAVLVAVPFRTLPGFRFVLRALDLLDSVLLCAPFVRRQAWMVIFVLSRPRKE